MFKKYVSLLFIGLLLNLAFSSSVFAQDTEVRAAEKVKIKIARLGTGGRTISVKLKDKTKIKGYITEIKDDYFVLVNRKNAASTQINYNQVKSIGIGFSNFQKVLLGAGLGLAAVFIITTICVANGRCDE